MMMNRTLAAALAALTLAACNDTTGPDDGGVAFTWDFTASTHGWTANFADYPVGEDGFYELESGHTALPAPLDVTKKGLLMAGNNHSDDLLMYITRRVQGLEPSTRYRVRYEVQIATDAPKGCAGVGSPPGEAVYVKSGAAGIEPVRIADDANHWRLNVDIGNQSADGPHGITIGDVSNTNTDCTSPVYQLKTLSSSPRILEVVSDASGDAWLIVGVDSGFEATTRLWYTRIEARLTPVD